ncbi:hypothetical protein RSK20926_09649 [Roseobacter sp. SK209-2-6]|nr:hypothetical protein RSK20926_09649 [Roseobacter sp. SK209-2-6]
MVFWSFGMATGLASGGCRKGLTQPDRTDRACRISRFGLMGFRKIGQPQKPGDAELYIGYAVERFRAGAIEQANSDFETAYEWGRKSRHKLTLNSGYKIPEALFAAILRVHHDHVPVKARAIWYAILKKEAPDLVEALKTEFADRQAEGET